MILAVIQRRGEVVVPRGNTTITLHDRLVLGAEGYQDDIGIALKEIILKQSHPWAGQQIQNLDISRQTLIVMVRREDKVLIPNGRLKLRPGDTVLLYSKKNFQDAKKVNI